MLQAILVWTGAVLGVSLMLLMAIGPVIVEIDSWWFERKHGKAAAAAKEAEQQNEQKAAQPIVHHAA